MVVLIVPVMVVMSAIMVVVVVGGSNERVRTFEAKRRSLWSLMVVMVAIVAF